jgi:hypothetical protein
VSDDVVDRLETAATELEAARAAVAERGESELRRVRDAHDDATALLEEYRGKATGSGGEEFQAFMRFKKRFTELVEDLDDDLPHRDAFEEASDVIDRRRLSESHFDRAREALGPAERAVEVLQRRADARAEYREARRAARGRLSELGNEIGDAERLQELGAVDLDASVEWLRDPIEAYNDAVTEAFREFRTEASARELLALAETAADYPLGDVDPPPADLLAYVRRAEAGAETVPTLLTYADYSRSKLSHYVDEPAALKRQVATERTYLERLDGTALTVGWPPPSAETLRYRCDELVSLVTRFAEESVVDRLRTVEDRTRDTERYERLRTVAQARQELTDEQRRRLQSGAVAERLAALREEQAAIEAALAEHDSL